MRFLRNFVENHYPLTADIRLIDDTFGGLRRVDLTFPRKDVVTAKIETSFALERNDPLAGGVDDGGPRGTKPRRRLSDVHFIDAVRSGGL